MKKGKKPVRLATLLLCVTCLVSALAGCGSGTGDQASSEPEGPQSEINITEGTTDGVLEGAAATEMVDKVVATISSNTLETSPFSPPSSSMTMKPMMYATLIYRDYYGAPLEDCSMWVAKSVTKVDDLSRRSH